MNATKTGDGKHYRSDSIIWRSLVGRIIPDDASVQVAATGYRLVTIRAVDLRADG